MRASALPFRVLYALVAAPVASIGGFYAGVLLLPRILPGLHGDAAADAGWGDFVLAVLLAGAIGFTAFLYALTLPWRRLRRRRGRPLRITLSAALVLLVSVSAAAEAVPVGYIAGVTVWMALVLTFTFIRYGIRDGARSGQAPREEVRLAR